MVKWVDEKVLQQYFIENSEEYSLFIEGQEREITDCEPNSKGFDYFPDLECYIDGEMYPAEVEWLSSKYDHFDHDDHQHYVDQGLFLVVFRKDEEVRNFLQVEIDRDHFVNWFDRNAERLINNSIEEYEKEAVKSRDYPKVWGVYVSTSGEMNFQTGEQESVWGFTEDRFNQPRAATLIRQVQEKDIVLFVGPITTRSQYTGDFNPRSGVDKYLEQYLPEKALSINQVAAFRVTEGYWDERDSSEFREIWNDSRYPHRFQFSQNPIFRFEDIPAHELAESTFRPLHQIMHHSIDELEYPHFMEIVSNFSG
ncbi:hypothetical protein [Halosimplex sp. J119]